MALGDATAGTAERVENPSLNRVKQSEELLARLYVVEEKTNRVGRGSINLMLLVSVLSLVAFIATVLMRYNVFVVMFEDALSKRSNFEVEQQRRDNLFGNLVKLTLNHAALEHSIFSHAADKRSEALEAGRGGDVTSALEQLMKQGGLGKLLGADPNSLAKGLAADGGFGAAMGRLMAVVEQYPNIQSADTYKHMMTSLVEMEDRIAKKRQEFNDTAALYNAEITKWPWDYLAVVAGFKRMDYFHEKAEGDTPVITPELFQQLLPLAKVQETHP